MTTSTLTAEARAIWLTVHATEPDMRVREAWRQVDEPLRLMLESVFINGYIAGALAHGAQEAA